MENEPCKQLNISPIGGGKRRDYESINGLRAYAAVGIVAMHVLSNIAVKPAETFLTTAVIGRMGELVLLFMMVSAFGMCCGYYERMRQGLIRPADFYKKRYQRVLPFFALLVALDLALSPSWASLAEGFSDLTLVFGLYPGADIKVIGVGWFLGTIFVFYMLFPFFTFLIDNRRRAWFVLLLALVWQLLMMHYYDAAGNAQLLYSAPYFIVGGLIFLYREAIERFFSKGFARWGGLVLAIFATVAFYAFPVLHASIFGSNLPRLVLYGLWLSYAIGTSDFLLNNKLTAFLSAISMEIYLSHMVIFRAIEKAHADNLLANPTMNYFLTVLLTLTGAVIFSYVMKNLLLPRVKFVKAV